MAARALGCRGEDIILRSTTDAACVSFSLLLSQHHTPWGRVPAPLRMLLSHFRWGIRTPFRKTPVLCYTHTRVAVGMKPGVSSVAPSWRWSCSLSLLPHCRKRRLHFSPGRSLTICQLGDLISSQIISGLLERWTHCTFSAGPIISILETVIYEILTFFHHVFTPSKAKNIVIVCDVLKTLVTSWSQMLINVKCFLKNSAFGSLTGLTWHYPSASSSDNCSPQTGANLVIMVLTDFYVSLLLNIMRV